MGAHFNGSGTGTPITSRVLQSLLPFLAWSPPVSSTTKYIQGVFSDREDSLGRMSTKYETPGLPTTPVSSP